MAQKQILRQNNPIGPTWIRGPSSLYSTMARKNKVMVADFLKLTHSQVSTSGNMEELHFSIPLQLGKGKWLVPITEVM